MEILQDNPFTAMEERGRYLSGIIFQHIDPQATIRVLDLGCGTGKPLFHLAQLMPNADFTGIDISAQSIETANASLERHPFRQRIRFHAADYMTFYTEPFDLIISDSVFHLIHVQADVLFTKVAGDMVTGGFLVATMPYDCPFNRALWTIRRAFKKMHSPLTDRIILSAGKLLHGKRLSEELIRERIHYMYSIPSCYISDEFYARLRKTCGLEVIHEQLVPHASIAQPKHKAVFVRKMGA